MAEKWEYKNHQFYRGTEYLVEFNELGGEGWELIQVDYGHEGAMAIFKRPKTEPLPEVTIGQSSLLSGHWSSSATLGHSYHYLLPQDRGVAWIGYCPWCGDDI